MPKDAVQISFLENFMLSGLAAVTSKTAAAPIERVKLLIQNQDEMIKQGRLKTPYKGMMDCTMRVYAEEGVGPFWRGNLANVIRYFPTQALNFAFKDKIKAMFKVPKDAPFAKRMGSNIISGGLAGALSLCFVYSLDFARTRLANDNKAAGKGGEREFNGLLDVYKKIMATEGIAGLYRGFSISCVGILVYRGFYFGLYDTIIPSLGKTSNFAVNFAVGYAVTVVSGILSYPIDTIRRRLMMTSGQAVKYNGAMDCAAQIMKNEGFMSFFKGAGANILRGVAGAGVLSGFTEIKKMYIKKVYPNA